MKLCTLFFEFSSFIMFFSVIYYLYRKKDYRAIAHIYVGSCFGVLLEFFTVFAFDAYSYSTAFLIQVGSAPNNIPIAIGLYWGLIIYSCMKISDRFGINEWAKPFLDALLALTIDFSMDTIAIRVDGGFWTWKVVPFESVPTVNSFFGVFYGNFYGWIFVVLIFSYLLRLEYNVFYKKFKLSKTLTVLYFLFLPLFAYIPLYLLLPGSALPVLLVLDKTMQYPFPREINFYTMIYVLIICVLVTIIAFIKTKEPTQKGFEGISIIVFSYFHVVFLAFFFIGGFFSEAPLILPLALLMLIVDLVIHIKILDRRSIRN